MLQSFPRWKYTLLGVVLFISLIYSLPNIFGEEPAIQVGKSNIEISSSTHEEIKEILTQNNIKVKKVKNINGNLIICLDSVETQLKAKDILQNKFKDKYSIALNLAPATPKWLMNLGAKPMKLGLDLRGGVQFLMDVDINSILDRRLDASILEIKEILKQEKISYQNLSKGKNRELIIIFFSEDQKNKALVQLKNKIQDLEFTDNFKSNIIGISANLNAFSIVEIRNDTIERSVSTLRNRVNELGVAEAVVQRQGQNKIVIELPGIQDTAYAKEILGKTATLEFLIVDNSVSHKEAARGLIPPGSKLLRTREGQPILVKKKLVLSGEDITGASSGFDAEDGMPVVNVRLGGNNVANFGRITQQNVHKNMAIVYKESKLEEIKNKDGSISKQTVTTEEVISAPVIREAMFTSKFRITGVKAQEARDLALLLRSGAMPATTSIVEEHIIGPSMGQENIDKGIISVIVGLCLVLIFMTIYYSFLGFIANIALIMNLILLVAAMSLLGATLTLPGIAGIVLTLGMAVDANVLIFERIREEMRIGMPNDACISRGFEHAFATIVDANLTTLIVGLVLFAIGTGPVKGFAVTLSLGILTSMFTSITGTRAMIELFYGNKSDKKILVGI